MDALKISNLTKHYSGFTLDNVSLTLPLGCVMGFIGENGAGKSTTINLILDLIQADGGEVSILGSSNRGGNTDIKNDIGVVLDESNFPETLTAASINRMMGLAYKNWSSDTFEAHLRRFSLPPKKQVKEYSRGMKMKLSIAAALSHDAKLLILDEATSGLDPVVRDEILDIFFEFIQDEGHSIFMSSHITSDLEKICDYISFIHQGRLLFCEEKDALLNRFGILKCTREEMAAVAPSAVHGIRETGFGVEALVEREKVPRGLATDPVSIDDIIVFMVRGERK